MNIDWKKIVRGATLASAGAGLTYIAAALSTTDLGNAKLILVALITTGLDVIARVSKVSDT